jgi:uncharacterized protein
MDPVTEAEERRYAELQALALDAARTGDLPQLQPMLAAGMPVNLADHKGNTLLMLAAYHGHAEAVQCLIEHGAAIDQRNDRHQTPLGGVAFKGYVEVAQRLLAAGADVNADNGNGMTPLAFAQMFGRQEVVCLLKSAQARTGQSWIKRGGLRIVGLIARAALALKRASPKGLKGAVEK